MTSVARDNNKTASMTNTPTAPSERSREDVFTAM